METFDTVKELNEYLVKWLAENLKAVQLDGSEVRKSSQKVAVKFKNVTRYGTALADYYCLKGDIYREAIEVFVEFYSNCDGDWTVVLKPEETKGGNPSFWLTGYDKPTGWYCYKD